MEKKNSGQITQNIKLLQGDSLSPTLFMFISDIVTYLTSNTENLKVLLFADDLVFYSSSSIDIQIGLKNLGEYCSVNELEVNASKTKIMNSLNKLKQLLGS